MRYRRALLLTSLLVGVAAAGPVGALSEFGMEGSHVVSTAADEIGASVSPDGQRIVWGRRGPDDAIGRSELWQARLVEGRWQDAAPLSINAGGADSSPAFSADGRWLYFVSDRDGGFGGDDLYRSEVLADGRFGAPQNLGPAVNTAADERSPAPGADGRWLMFASAGHGGAGGMDLLAARWDGGVLGALRALPGINSDADEFDGVWLGDGETVVFARTSAEGAAPVQLHLARCDSGRYGPAEPLALSFNTADGVTRAAGIDWSKPRELLVTGSARSPRAGGLDIYRMRAPTADGSRDCLD